MNDANFVCIIQEMTVKRKFTYACAAAKIHFAEDLPQASIKSSLACYGS
jgi:hypothetical protein